MREALVFGGSGQIGRALLRSLQRSDWQVTAVSRQARRHGAADAPGVQWVQGDLDRVPALPARFDAIFSCGPLDAFARWYAGSRVDAERVIAFGSTSLSTKQASSDAHERDIASRLQQGEATVLAAATTREAAATLLRPTLVYGAGRDATLTRIAEVGRRFGRFPLPRGADGLRQPVHVDDLASAAHACIDASASFAQAYALPGGETLAYREMVARVLGTLEPPARLLELPAPLFALALRLARVAGRAGGAGDAVVQRMREDLVFDAGPAQRDFAYAPRRFVPTAEMFVPREA